MDRSSKILIAIIIIGVVASLAVLYRNTMMSQSFEIIQNENGIPEVPEE